MDQITLEQLRALSPRAGSGMVRRILDGAVQDEAAFLFSAPAHWRVRHRNGEEIVVRDEEWWARPERTAAWDHDRAEPGTTPHHNGYLQAMLVPALLPAIGDGRSVIVAQESRADGSRRLTIRHHEPVDGVMTAEVSPDGHLTRIESRDDGVVLIELHVDSWEASSTELFDPDVEWTTTFDE